MTPWSCKHEDTVQLFASQLRLGVFAWGLASESCLIKIVVLQKKAIRKIEQLPPQQMQTLSHIQL